MSDQNGGGTWPEQEIVDAWIAKHLPYNNLKFYQLAELKEAVTKPRLEIQQQRDRAIEREAVKDAALQFYADKKMWEAQSDGMDGTVCPVGEDFGDRARAALSHPGTRLIEALREYYEAAEDVLHLDESKGPLQPRMDRYEKAKRALAGVGNIYENPELLK